MPTTACWLYLVTVMGAGCLSTVASAQHSTASHRAIPRSADTPPPSLQDVIPLDFFQLWQNITRAQSLAAAPSQRAPASMPFESPSVPSDQFSSHAADVVKNLSQQLGRSMVEAFNTDIAEFASEANRNLADQLNVPRDPSNGAVRFDPGADIDRNLDDFRREMRAHQEEFRTIMEQYQRSWPAAELPPSEWLQKVKPFISRELVQQLTEFAKDLKAQKAQQQSALGPRPSERQSGAPRNSSAKAATSKHSNAVVGSVLKAFESQSTSLIKSAVTRKPSRKQSLWSRMRNQSKAKMREWNRRVMDNSRQVAAQRRRLPNATPGIAWPSGDASREGGIILGAGALAFTTILLVWLRRYRRRLGSDSQPHALPPPRTIKDRHSLLQACHGLAAHLFGHQSRFWNHQQLFSRLQSSTQLDRAMVQHLRDVYERARYTHQPSHLSREDLIGARQVFHALSHRVARP